MGSRPFAVVGRGKNIETAFWSTVLREIAAHGDDGYTGTLAEKYEYVLFDTDGVARAGDIARWAIDFNPERAAELPSGMPAAVLPLITRVAGITDDKWGPAAAIRLTAGETLDPSEIRDEEVYLFFGRASY